VTKNIRFAAQQTAKSPYKFVANFAQNRIDWLAVLHGIGDIGGLSLEAILTVSLDAALTGNTCIHVTGSDV
jgi:hypothetical protein